MNRINFPVEKANGRPVESDGRSSEKKLKICMLAACPFPANHGTPGSIREMAEAVAELGHEVHVVTYHFGEDIPVEGARIHRITPVTDESSIVVGPTVRKPLYDLQMVFKAIEVIRRHKIDVLQAHGYEAALAAFLCKMATGIPIVYNGHNTMADELPTYDFIRPRWLALGLGRLLDSIVPRLADRLMPHSANMLEVFQKMGLKRRCESVLQIGIDMDWNAYGDGSEVRRQYGLENCPVVLYAGVTDRFQRLDLLLKAMVTVLSEEPRTKLFLVTTIPNAQQLNGLRRLAAELGISDNVVISEPQSLVSVRRYLAACDVAVVPRPRTPGFPMKMLNYMASRKPCILFRSSAPSDLSNRANALLVSPDTGEALGKAIVELIRDPELADHLTESAYDFVRARHDRRLTAKQIIEACNHCLGQDFPSTDNEELSVALPPTPTSSAGRLFGVSRVAKESSMNKSFVAQITESTTIH